MISFLAPAFFAGLIALAIPVIVHLTRRHRKSPVAFPSLMFVSRVPHESVRRRRIRHWPLLLLRCLAIALVVLAFARPFLDRSAAAGAAVLGEREVVILLDRSYSMGYGDRWQRAVAAAREAVDALGPTDRATLVAFDAAAAVTVPATADRARLHAALDTTRVGSATTRYVPALKLAQSTLAGTARPRREVVLITDFQRAGWDGSEAVPLPAGTRFTPIAVGDADEQVSNVGITSMAFRREMFSGRERIIASARLANQGAREITVPVELQLGERTVQSRTVRLPADGAATVTFAPFTLAERNARGAVRLPADRLPQDDRFHFVLSPGEGVGVLILEDPAAGAQQSLYLRRALAIGGTPGFRTEIRPANRFRASDLAGRSVVVLNDVAFPAGEAGERLRSFVENGGGLVVLAGQRMPPGAWAGDAAGLLPGRLGRTVDSPARDGESLAQLRLSHPVFELFRTPRSGDFGTARIFRYRAFEPTGTASVLARTSGGAVLLAEQVVGQGRALLWTSPLDGRWNDLALQPVFLPFAHQLVRYAAGFRETPPWSTAGEVLSLRSRLSERDDAADAWIALTPSGQRVPLAEPTRSLRLEEQGFYTFQSARSEAPRSEVVAVNLDPREADFAQLAPAELVREMEAAPAALERAAAFAPTAAEREQSQRVWWYVLLAGLVLLAVEVVLANRVARVAP